jgi:hypothetical protein
MFIFVNKFVLNQTKTRTFAIIFKFGENKIEFTRVDIEANCMDIEMTD